LVRLIHAIKPFLHPIFVNLTIKPAASFRHFPVLVLLEKMLHLFPDLPTMVFCHTTALEGGLNPVPKLLGEPVFFPVLGHTPRHLLLEHLFDCLPSILSVEEDDSTNAAPEENKQDHDEASKHAARLVGCPTATKAGEESEKSEEDEGDDDEREVRRV